MTVSIRDVAFTYPGADSPALRDLTLEVAQGEFVALVGRNGCGKTTLCKLLTGIVPHFFEGDFEGDVLVDGHNTRETRVGDLARLVGYVYQDFENQLLKPRVLEDVMFAPLNFGIVDHRDRAVRALKLLGMQRYAERIIWELSGGEQHLVALAGALALDPDIVVVDEPVSQLDPLNAEAVYERLASLNRDHGKTVIVIEHEPEFIGAYCDSVVLLDSGTVAWKLPVRQALGRAEELACHDFFAPQVTRVFGGLARAGAPTPAEHPVDIDSAVQLLRPGLAGKVVRGTDHKLRAVMTDTITPESRAPVARFDNVTHSYATMGDERRTVLDRVDLVFGHGQRIALVGSNGAGKSTILRAMAGLVKVREGTVEVLGRDTRKLPPEELAGDVALVYQDPQQMFVEECVEKDIGLYLRERRLDDAEETVERALADFGLADLRDRDARLLSGGQMRRTSLAIAAAMRPRLLLLDEPTSSLDVASRTQVTGMLRRLDDWVSTVVVATHDMELVAEWASRVIIMSAGRVIADATPAGLFCDPAMLAQANVRAPQVTRLGHALGMASAHLTVEGLVAELAAHFLGSPDDEMAVC